MAAAEIRPSAQGAAESSSGQPTFSLISNEKLLQIYSAMVRCRMVEERAGRIAGQSHASSGPVSGRTEHHEACVVGVAVDLEPEDAISSTPGDLLCPFMKGEPPERIFARLISTSPGKRKERSFSAPPGDSHLHMIPSSASVAAQLNIAAGVALAHKMRKSGKIVAAFFRENSASLGPAEQALQFAGCQALPILFVARHSSASPSANGRRPVRDGDLSAKAQAFGIPGIVVDNHDAVAVYRVAHEAIVRARKGRGPTLIECTGYRLPGQTPEASTHDPIANMETYLARKRLFTPDLRQSIFDGFKKELDEAARRSRRRHAS